MTHINDLGRIVYMVPLRITLRAHETPLIERNAREHEEYDIQSCIDEPARCAVNDLRHTLAHVHVRPLSVKGIQGVRYVFHDRTPELRVLVTPDSYDIKVIDRDANVCPCRGVAYHDHHRMRHKIDVDRVSAALLGHMLELLLPRT